ncbi:MAG: hypothetical protein JWL97_3404, partial [Gemmatimonadales bacterium]|nr:hypothetical protein [Gemmatimonadales bacterium]
MATGKPNDPLGERFPILDLKLPDLQSYVDRRAKARGMRGG